MEKTFAVIENNLVTNVIVAESKEMAELVTGHTCIEYTAENPAGINWTWDGTSFINPFVVVEETVEEEPTEDPA